MNALATILVLFGLVLCASAQFGFGGPAFGRGPTVTKTVITETRPGFGNNGFNNGFNRGPGFNNGFNNGFNRGPGFHRHGGFNNGFNGGFNNGPTVTRTITTFSG